jgi:hypothetical protein
MGTDVLMCLVRKTIFCTWLPRAAKAGQKGLVLAYKPNETTKAVPIMTLSVAYSLKSDHNFFFFFLSSNGVYSHLTQDEVAKNLKCQKTVHSQVTGGVLQCTRTLHQQGTKINVQSIHR